MAEITVDAKLSRMDSEYVSGPKGLAPDIRRIALKYPEMTSGDIARQVGCTPQNVRAVLSSFFADVSEEKLRAYQENQAEVFESVALRLLESVTQEKIDKTKPMEAITGAAILIDKARLVRGQATGINVTVLMDVVEAIRTRQAMPAQQVSSTTQQAE